MVRYMTGTAVQYARGEISRQDVIGMLEKPETPPNFIRKKSLPKGLTMVESKFKEGCLFKEPQYIEEKNFMLGYKQKLKEMGIDYVNPDEDQDLFGNVFSDSD